MAAAVAHLSLCASVARACTAHLPSPANSLACVAPTGVSSIGDARQVCSLHSSWKRDAQRVFPCPSTGMTASTNYRGVVIAMSKPVIQFIRGVDEMTIPNISLTRSKDQTNGVATFVFEQPSIFDSSRDLGDITGFYMIDEEGTLQSVDVNAKFVNGKPAKIEARFVMRNLNEWDRFMRFMERYATDNNLGFVKK